MHAFRTHIRCRGRLGGAWRNPHEVTDGSVRKIMRLKPDSAAYISDAQTAGTPWKGSQKAAAPARSPVNSVASNRARGRVPTARSSSASGSRIGAFVAFKRQQVAPFGNASNQEGARCVPSAARSRRAPRRSVRYSLMIWP